MIEHDFAEFDNIPRSKSIANELNTLSYMQLQISKKDTFRPRILFRLIEHCKIRWKSLMLPACLGYLARVHIVQTKASDMRMGLMQRQEQYEMKDSDARRRWGAEVLSFSSFLC